MIWHFSKWSHDCINHIFSVFFITSLLVCVCLRLILTSCSLSIIASLSLYSGPLSAWEPRMVKASFLRGPSFALVAVRKSTVTLWFLVFASAPWQALTDASWHTLALTAEFQSPCVRDFNYRSVVPVNLITIFNRLYGSTRDTVYHHLIRMEFVIFLHCYFYKTLCKMWKKTDWALLWMCESTCPCETEEWRRKKRRIFTESRDGWGREWEFHPFVRSGPRECLMRTNLELIQLSISP